MKKITEESYELSTGKIIYPKCTQILIEKVKKGDGGTVGDYMYEVEEEHTDSPDLTIYEAEEFALYMADLWENIANSLK
jgi:hypothetical protein